MADIFISYSKDFQAQTQQLANELRAKGFTVWYDTSLVPGDSFRDVIISELAQARAAIVIWTTYSVKSDWVCSEASRARARGILIPVRADDVRSHDIPPPFDSLHTESLSNRSAIEAALAKLGVAPTLAVKDEPSAQPAPIDEPARPALALPNKPSIAVLPFQNMSGDPDQEYFADGMAEEIITALSRMRWLFVIARNSSFTYKGRGAGVKQVARELGVRYLLEGSVRKAASRVRISAQLIDSSTGGHLWADRFDGGLEDIFDLQDRVMTSVVGAIEPKLRQAEIERAKHKPTDSLDAYDYFLRGLASFHLFTSAENDNALAQFSEAIRFDPEYASAYGMATWCHQRRYSFGWGANPERDGIEAMRLARRAVAVGKDDPVALYAAGFTFVLVAHDVEGGGALIDRALQLNSNDAVAWGLSGVVHSYLGNPETAIEHIQRAMRLSPLDPFFYLYHGWLARAQFVAARYEEAAASAERALRAHPDYMSALCIGTAAYALLCRPGEARRLLVHITDLQPQLRVSTLKDHSPFQRPADLAAYEQALRTAGLPE